jgi:ParB family transcriptional regulator, chromosome partitioning protein
MTLEQTVVGSVGADHGEGAGGADSVSSLAVTPLAVTSLAVRVLEGSLMSANEPLVLHLPPDHIEIVEGFNPRQYIDPNHVAELADSIKEVRCVISPITVRPKKGVPGRFLLVVGECRLRAALLLELPSLPCVVRELTDREALALALAENAKRKDTTPADDAYAARRMLALCEGNREEALRNLKWSAATFDARLLLLHATPNVLMAVCQKKIKLGHAELLSSLEPQNQERGLEGTLKEGWSVADLQQRLAAYAQDLSTARFDLAGCQACPHNTTTQASLFEQTLGEGRCVNRTCFQGKTLEYVAELRVALRDQYAAVYLDTESEPLARQRLLAREVGTAQFDGGCKQCKFFGCLVSTAPGSVGQVTEDMCFNTDCHAEKVAAEKGVQQEIARRAQAHRVSQNEGADGEEDADDDLDPAESRGVLDTGAANRGGQEAEDARAHTSRLPPRPGAANGKSGGKVKAAAPPRRVQDAIDDIHRRAAATEVAANPKMAQVYAVLALLLELGALNDDTEDDPIAQLGIKREVRGETRVHLIKALYALDTKVLLKLTADLAARVAGGHVVNSHFGVDYLKGAQGTLRVLNTQLSHHFTLDAEFLAVHTKSGIESLLREAGFPLFFQDVRNSATAFTKMMVGKHAEIVTQATTSGFDWQGFVPKSLQVPK